MWEIQLVSLPVRFGCLGWGSSHPGFLNQACRTQGEDEYECWFWSGPRFRGILSQDESDSQVRPLLCEHWGCRGGHWQLPRGQHSQHVSDQQLHCFFLFHMCESYVCSKLYSALFFLIHMFILLFGQILFKSSPRSRAHGWSPGRRRPSCQWTEKAAFPGRRGVTWQLAGMSMGAARYIDPLWLELEKDQFFYLCMELVDV